MKKILLVLLIISFFPLIAVADKYERKLWEKSTIVFTGEIVYKGSYSKDIKKNAYFVWVKKVVWTEDKQIKSFFKNKVVTVVISGKLNIFPWEKGVFYTRIKTVYKDVDGDFLYILKGSVRRFRNMDDLNYQLYYQSLLRSKVEVYGRVQKIKFFGKISLHKKSANWYKVEIKIIKTISGRLEKKVILLVKENSSFPGHTIFNITKGQTSIFVLRKKHKFIEKRLGSSTYEIYGIKVPNKKLEKALKRKK